MASRVNRLWLSQGCNSHAGLLTVLFSGPAVASGVVADFSAINGEKADKADFHEIAPESSPEILVSRFRKKTLRMRATRQDQIWSYLWGGPPDASSGERLFENPRRPRIIRCSSSCPRFPKHCWIPSVSLYRDSTPSLSIQKPTVERGCCWRNYRIVEAGEFRSLRR
jgi:hypothetical protein